MRFSSFLLLSCIIILTLQLSSLEAEIIESSAEESKVIKVAFAEWPPWKITTGETIGGIDAEILYAIEDRSDFKFEFVIAPWKRCSEMLKLGLVDMITSYNETDERNEFAVYIKPSYSSGHIRFYYLKDTNNSIEKYEDIYGKKIGYVRGSSYFEKLDKDDNIMLEPVDFERQAFEMLLSHRVDLVIGWQMATEYELAKLDKLDMIQRSSYCPCDKHYGDWDGRINHSHLAFSRLSEKLIYKAEIETILKQLVDSGEIEKLEQEVLEKIGAENAEKK